MKTTKIAGKTEFSGRRRTATRTSGYSSHHCSTGGEWNTERVAVVEIGVDGLELKFCIPSGIEGEFAAYGCWYCFNKNITIDIIGGPTKKTHTKYVANVWNKLGSFWRLDSNPEHTEITVRFHPQDSTHALLAIYNPNCGIAYHDHFIESKDALLKNQYTLAPETNFYKDGYTGEVYLEGGCKTDEFWDIILKSCNRCARMLPINVPNERDHLSFSNHCVAKHRRPCQHNNFGRLRHVQTNEEMELEYGFQLECRFCKKFEVNAPLNPQRTAAQMKEDGARRRAFEVLLENLYSEAPQLRYRHLHGTELTDDVWDRFDGICFRCCTNIPSKNAMHLDHTRPLKLLWPLDGSATSLCASCNSEKRDRPPVEFYTSEQLIDLAALTGLDIHDLKDPSPNEEAINLLLSRIDWFFNEFLNRPEMLEVREGKIAGELVVNSLQKVISLSQHSSSINLIKEYNKRKLVVPPIE
jgi:hypothetical protein